MNIVSSLPLVLIIIFFLLSDVALHLATTLNDRLSTVVLISFSPLNVLRLSESGAYFNYG